MMYENSISLLLHQIRQWRAHLVEFDLTQTRLSG